MRTHAARTWARFGVPGGDSLALIEDISPVRAFPSIRQQSRTSVGALGRTTPRRAEMRKPGFPRARNVFSLFEFLERAKGFEPSTL